MFTQKYDEKVFVFDLMCPGQLYNGVTGKMDGTSKYHYYISSSFISFDF